MLAIKILNYNLENYYTESGACARLLPRHPPPFVAAPIHQNIRFNRTFAAFYMAFCRGAADKSRNRCDLDHNPHSALP
jgi:hypothetical protein